MSTTQTCKTIVVLLSFFLTQSIARSETVFPKQLEGTKSIEIGELILILLPDQGDAVVGWDHRAKSPIRWVTAGYETHKIDSGKSYYYRDGIVRTNIGGEVSQILRQDKVELGWTVSYINKFNPKFGVESVDLRPGTPKDVCFGSTHYGCDFDAPLKSLAAASISAKPICTRTDGADTVRAYELSHVNKRATVMLWRRSAGSGGASSDLSLLLTAEASPHLCALAQVGSQSDLPNSPKLQNITDQGVKKRPDNRKITADTQECAPTDIEVDALSTSNVRVVTRVTGRLINRCSSPTRPQVKFIFFGKNGALLRVVDAWPASVSNIPGKSDYPFEFSIEKVENLERVEARVLRTQR